MAARIQLNVQHFLELDGQWQIVNPGSVIDVADSNVFRGSSTLIAETAGSLGPRNTPSSVRNVSKK